MFCSKDSRPKRRNEKRKIRDIQGQTQLCRLKKTHKAMSQTGDHGAYTFTWMSSKATYAQGFKCLIWVSISAGSVNKIVPYFCVGTSFSSSFSTCWDSVQDLADSLMLLPCFQPIVSIEFCAYSYSSWSRSRLQLSLFKAFFLLFKEKKERKRYPSQALCCTSTICDVQSIPGVMFQ